MSHNDYISQPPGGLYRLRLERPLPRRGHGNRERKLYATQFHPEVEHTQQGQQMFHNFLYNIWWLCR